jgi:hypothetical protein
MLIFKTLKRTLKNFYRPKTNAIILLDMDHTLRGECAQEE